MKDSPTLRQEQLQSQVQRILEGDPRAVAKALSQVENRPLQEVRRLLQALFPHAGKALVVGVTGSPGAGKSTLVDQLARHYRGRGKRVGILAVDPTSPFSGGAILGDRIRMQSLSTDPGIFIRSMATRGRMGGLSAAVNDGLLILDAAGFQILLVETVGVGQDEVEIVKSAHITLVVLVPGMGDDVQTLKAGIMEIGDIFVINKADHPEAPRFEQHLQALLSLASRPDGWSPPLVKTVATKGEGIGELAEQIDLYREFLRQPEHPRERHLQLYRERLLDMLRERLAARLLERIPEEEILRSSEKMMTRQEDPYTIVDRLLRQAGFEEENP